jgi:hypothetical protein
MRASGGTIFGNWAIGRETSATAPTITVMIAMTIATIGRLMKNFDTARLLGGLRPRTGRVHRRRRPLIFWTPSATTRSPGWSPTR